MLPYQPRRSIAISLKTGSLECSRAIQGCRLGTMVQQQVGHGGVAMDQRLFSQGAVRVGMDTVGSGAVNQQPFGPSEMIVGDGVAQEIVERIQRNVAPVRPRFLPPLYQPVALLADPPKEVEPSRVVTGDGRIVERLRVVRIGAALDEQQGQLIRLRMRWLVAFAVADDAGQDLERIAPAIVELRVRVGAMVK